MKKRVLSLVLLLILLVPFASAEINDTESKAIQNSTLWLINQVDGKWTVLSSDDAALALLALSSDDRLAKDGKDALLLKGMNNECWPSPSCKIKSTALAVLALNKLGQDTAAATDWLEARKSAYTATGVTWILQIDSDLATNCTISYDSKSYTLNVNKDKTYKWAGSIPSCLSISSNYWIEISKTCLEKSFDVSCSNTAVVSLPYRAGNTLYIPSESFQTPATMAIRTVCMKEGVSCNYDSTLWAAYALQKTGNDFASLIPYLIDQKSENEKYMASAFLYSLAAKSEDAETLLASQARDGYWTDVGGYGKYYDTALAYWAIKDYSTNQAEKAKTWLIKEQKDGWGTTAKIRDTSIVLAFVWPTSQVVAPSNDCEAVYGYSCREECLDGEEQAAYSCISGICCKLHGIVVGCDSTTDCRKIECKGRTVSDSNGNQGKCEHPSELSCDDNFDNDGDGLIDFDDYDCTTTCAEKGYLICDETEVCSESVVRAYDTPDCCPGDCSIALTCSEQKGSICKPNQQCKNNAWLTSSDSSYCCSVKCSTKLGVLPFIIIALFLAIGGGAYFLYKKGFFKKKIGIKKQLFPSQPYPQQGYQPAVRPLQPQPQQPVNVNIKFQPPNQQDQRVQAQRFQQPSPERREAIKRAVKSDLDETLKKLKKLSEK